MIQKIQRDPQRPDAFFRQGAVKTAAAGRLGQTQRVFWVGVDELNFAEFPLAAIAGELPSGQKTLVFEDDIDDRGSNTRVHRKLTISASDLYGLPTPRDSDVLLVLVDLTKSVNGFSARTVPFRRAAILAALGWDDSGKSYQRLDESLQRWASVTLYYNGAWWDKSVKRWRSRTFHVLESLDLRGRDLAGAQDDSLSTFTWNEVVFASFEAKNIRNLDLDLYFRLERPASRQAYRFLAKRFWHNSALEFDLRILFCEHVGFSRRYDNAQLRRKARPMLEELEQVGFLVPQSDSDRYHKLAPGKWRIRLERTRAANQVAEEHLTPPVQALVTRGVRIKTAKELATAFGEARALEKIRLHDWLANRNDSRMSKSSAGFLVEAIRNDYRPEDFLAAERRGAVAVQAPLVRAAGAAKNPPKTYEDVLTSWRAMSSDEQATVERAAVAAAEPFQQATYERLQRAGGQLFTEVREELVGRHLKATRSESVPPGPAKSA